MSTEKIRWTSHQRDLVIAGILNLLKETPDICLRQDETFSSAFVRPLAERAQFVLPEPHRKPSFSFKFLTDLAQDVSHAWRKLQLEEATREALLSTVSVDRLISELASRQVDQVSNTVYTRIRDELFSRFNERLFKIEEVLGITPKIVLPTTESVQRVPVFALVGFLPEQVKSLVDEFKDQVVFKSVKDVGPAELRSVVTDRITLVSAFVSHSDWNTCRARAKEAHFVRHIRDIKPLIRSHLT